MKLVNCLSSYAHIHTHAMNIDKNMVISDLTRHTNVQSEVKRRLILGAFSDFVFIK